MANTSQQDVKQLQKFSISLANHEDLWLLIEKWKESCINPVKQV